MLELQIDQLLKKYQNVKSWKKCEDIVNNKIRNEEKQILIVFRSLNYF